MAEITNIAYNNTAAFIEAVDTKFHTLNILDAGAGSGILGIALIANLRKSGYTGGILDGESD